MGYVIDRGPSGYQLVCMHTKAAPLPLRWEAFVESTGQTCRKAQQERCAMGLLVLTDGGAPSREQQARFMAALDGYPLPTAVVSAALANPLMRAAANAAMWKNTDLKCFAPDGWAQALRYIKVDPSDVEHIWNALVYVQLELPYIQTLAKVADVLQRPRPRARRSGAMAHSND